MTQTPSSAPSTDRKPWYRYPYVWLVIAGPAIVVVAAVYTGYVAYRDADGLVDKYSKPHDQVNVQSAAETSMLPANQGRNQAAQISAAQQAAVLAALEQLSSALAQGEWPEAPLQALDDNLPAAALQPLHQAIDRFDFSHAQHCLDSLKAKLLVQTPTTAPLPSPAP